uniref:Uncharacterized protein n=1 Tax=uncultured marine virus TaxID=186617 RepID=A0A0F7L2Q6_9VIRU|nr:hypothetical protein [uncultured marine virus]
MIFSIPSLMVRPSTVSANSFSVVVSSIAVAIISGVSSRMGKPRCLLDLFAMCFRGRTPTIFLDRSLRSPSCA